MDFAMPESVNILGNRYTIEVKKIEDDYKLSTGPNGYCDSYGKKIVIADLSDASHYPCASRDKKLRDERYKHTLRHEIVHGFFYESGLGSAAKMENTTWVDNETLVDFLAIQGPKLYAIWDQLGIL